MNIEDMSMIIKDEQDSLNNIDKYKKLFCMNNYLDKYDILCRMLILHQYEDAFDVKSKLQWNTLNREVVKDARKIYVLCPIKENVYKYSDSGEVLKHNALTSIEISNAIKIGMIKKEVDILGFSIDCLYDVRDTKPINGSNSSYENNSIPKVHRLLELTEYILNVTINKINGDRIQYFKNSRQIFIPKTTYKELVSSLVNIIVDNILSDNEQCNLKIYTKDIILENIKLVKETMKYSLNTKFGCDYTIDIKDIISELDNELLLSLVIEIDSIITSIISCIPLDYDKNKAYNYSSELMKKAENLLDIMEANLMAKELL